MDYKLVTKHFDVTEELQNRIDKKLGKLAKFNKWINHIEIIISGEGDMQNTEINAYLDHKQINSKAKGRDAYITFANAFSKFKRQLEEYETRVTDHHGNR